MFASEAEVRPFCLGLRVAIFDRLVFPRLSAVAEAGWTLPERKSWDRFAAMAGLMPIMYGHWARE